MYVTNFSMVGINAPWGTGKSFVVDQLKRDPDFLKEFELISIDLLTCDLDQVERIIIEELDKVFRKHYIHSAHSFRLKGLIGKNQWSNLLWGILGNEGEGIAASLQGFQKELRKLDKKILLIFDDLDRISETNTTKKIFAIAEKIACDHLHVVYQYDISALLGLVYGDNVIEKHGINRDRTGDREKTRYLCGKQGIFTRDRALIRPGFIRQLETRASTRSASFFHALGSPGRPHNGGGAAGAYRTRNGAKPLKQGHFRAKRGPLGPSRKSQQQTKRTGFAAHGHSIAETAQEGKRASRANGALIRA